MATSTTTTTTTTSQVTATRTTADPATPIGTSTSPHPLAYLLAPPHAQGNWITVRDGHEVYTRTYSVPSSTPLRGTVTFVHGLGEHCDRYTHIFPLLAEAGYQVHAYDQRGFGRTGIKSGSLGHTGGWDTVLGDVREAIERNTVPGKPRFLYGHSMGGIIVLDFLRRFGAEVVMNGVIVSSPAIGTPPAVKPAAPILTLLRLVKPAISWVTLTNSVDPRGLSHDDAVIAAYTSDPLVHASISVDMGGAIIAAGDHIASLTPEQIATEFVAHTPLYFVHGDKDPITHAPTTFEFAKRAQDAGLQDVTCKRYEGMKHELHNEPECVTDLVKGYIEWLDQRS
ncbi:Alpha/Beta hydrolase protein [Catenaria anguillulae PL171]|uniref:Alpha/Beta hydrolase protein n=1 Tax=Catenaria anguillulae PL171 TaxID=765915 RepID=A0A1Y2HKP5_9FUNG|nr:Alpha/Beta hydrolase protein [Catenaria anguillulae PL171]